MLLKSEVDDGRNKFKDNCSDFLRIVEESRNRVCCSSHVTSET